MLEKVCFDTCAPLDTSHRDHYHRCPLVAWFVGRL